MLTGLTTHVDLNEKFCVYVKWHPKAGYYLGKSLVARVLSGYQGSGKRLRDTYTKYPHEQWNTEIVFTTDDELAAFDREGELVNEKSLRCPDILNLKPGGRGGTTRTLTAEHKAHISASGKGRKDSAAVTCTQSSVAVRKDCHQQSPRKP